MSMNNNEDTLTSLVSKFLFSTKSNEFKLIPSQISVLYVVAYFCDMDKKSNLCFANLEKISEYSRLSKRSLIEQLDKLVSYGILSKNKNWKNSFYSISKIVTNIDYNCQKTSGAEFALDEEKSELSGAEFALDKSYQVQNLHLNTYYNKYNNINIIDHTKTHRSTDEKKMNNVFFVSKKDFELEKNSSHESCAKNFLNRFEESSIEKIISIWPFQYNRNQCIKVWCNLSLESQFNEIKEKILKRLEEDENFLEALRTKNSKYIPRLENFLNKSGWLDENYPKISNKTTGVIKNGQLKEDWDNGGRSVVRFKTASERSAAVYRYSKAEDE